MKKTSPANSPSEKIKKNALYSVQKNLPSHLYRRGENYYFRMRIPHEYRSLCQSEEIRFSLKTDSLRQAKNKAALFTSYLYAAFQKREMVGMEDLEQFKARINGYATQDETSDPEVHAIYEWLNEHGCSYSLQDVADNINNAFPFRSILPKSLFEFSSQWLSKFLQGKKSLISNNEIREKIESIFREELEHDADNPLSRTQTEKLPFSNPFLFFNSPIDLGITQKNIYSLVFSLHKKVINNPPLLCIRAKEILEFLNTNKILKKDCVTFDNYLLVVNEYCKYLCKFLDSILARLENDFQKENVLFPPVYKPSSIAFPNNKVPNNSKVYLSKFIDKYLQSKISDGKKTERNIPELRRKLEVFLEFTGDKNIEEYSRDDFRNFRNMLKDLPPSFSLKKMYKGMNVTEIAYSNKNSLNKLSTKTINGYIIAINSLFNWLETEGYISQNLGRKLTLPDDSVDTDAREPFTQDDLKKIFTSEKFISLKKSDKPSFYWIPWIGLYTGMRLEEISQLQCSDIYKDNNLWIININNDSSSDVNKKLKTKNSKRQVPIHPYLIKLGLIEYLENIKKQNVRLFPDLTAKGERKQYGKIISKKFGPFIRSLGIEGKKSFHSLRHSFDNFFKRLGLEDTTIFKEMFGHSTSNKGLTSSRYGSKFTPKECYDKLISKINFGLEN